MEDYLKLYESSPKDRQNPYFAPILEEDLSHMPDTLIVSMNDANPKFALNSTAVSLCYALRVCC